MSGVVFIVAVVLIGIAAAARVDAAAAAGKAQAVVGEGRRSHGGRI